MVRQAFDRLRTGLTTNGVAVLADDDIHEEGQGRTAVRPYSPECRFWLEGSPVEGCQFSEPGLEFVGQHITPETPAPVTTRRGRTVHSGLTAQS